MNEVAFVDNVIMEIEKRREYFKTKKGQTEVAMAFTEIFSVLNGCGYKMPDADKVQMSKVWAYVLGEYVETYGIDKVKQGVLHFIANDNREYKSFPKPSDLIQSIKAVGGIDPRLVKKKQEAEAREKQLIEAHRREINEEWDSKTPEEQERLLKQAKERLNL